MPLSGTNLTNSSTINTREGTDFYPTPPPVTIALLRFLAPSLPLTTRIWEPACGEGHMSRTIESLGYEVVSTDLYDDGYGGIGTNYLSEPSPRAPFVITNPPFRLAEGFINHSLTLDLDGFALLLKSQFWHSAKRHPLFAREGHGGWLLLPLTVCNLHYPRLPLPLT